MIIILIYESDVKDVEGVLVFEASYQITGPISNMNDSQPLNTSICTKVSLSDDNLLPSSS